MPSLYSSSHLNPKVTHTNKISHKVFGSDIQPDQPILSHRPEKCYAVNEALQVFFLPRRPLPCL